ncbi:putative DD41D transposase [Trichonephila clavipes]|nr:putative DD41D transposase [Trichonephila clavipes]
MDRLFPSIVKMNSQKRKNCQVIYSQFGLAIRQNDHQARRRFVEWTQNEIAVVPDFHKRILFSDEAHFWLNGYVNEQNCRIWSEANPQVYVEKPLHPEKLTVWCALWAGGIIGPYFFKNDEGRNVTANGDRYRAMITNFFIPELNNHDVQERLFQQDGATCHTAPATIDLLKDTFGDRLISRFGPVNWPPRSCDITPLDYFLWGYVKYQHLLMKEEKQSSFFSTKENVMEMYMHKIFKNLYEEQIRVGPPPAAIHAATRSGIKLIDILCCLEADGPTNLEQPTLNHVQSDTMAPAVLADPTRALQGTNRGSGPAMDESENNVGSLEQLLLSADEHYLAGKFCPWETNYERSYMGSKNIINVTLAR